ncbi:hypothetical protein FB45DRAFT_1003327 [Roridomyces roridus]|uniref:F-box domain-containing protein n=1 Tax=Roridomyces roridus TaxID=1738132 RepID=A0AAD7BXK1_9AGAR|nr:hypothetical protein FB45DRAFT_1003327 [Roridomyces roridus]
MASFDDKSTLAATRARISQLDADMQKLQRVMHSLLAERKKCQQVLADYTYPILTLPSEITSEIFLYFLPPYPQRPSFWGYQSPSFLLRICRRWRDVALTTPALWSGVQLTIDPQRHVRQSRLLDMWLQRSRNCPLSIQLGYSEELMPSEDEEDEDEEGFVESLRSHAMRWQEMDISLPLDNLRKITGSMPLLRRLTIGVDRWDTETPLALFTDAPALKHVVLRSSFTPFIVALPWSQLTTLTLEGLFANEAVEMLRQTSMLQDLTVTIHNGQPPTYFSIPPLPLRSLKLHYYRPGADEYHQLFKALQLPMLQTLSVHEEFLGPNPVASLFALRPNGYPQEIQILGARTSRETYAAAFPLASLSVYVTPYVVI